MFSVAFSLFFAGNLFCQNKLSVSMDISQFRFNADSSLVEVYYGILPGESNDSSVASYALSLSITENKTEIIKNIWKIQDQSSPVSEEGKQQMVLDVMRYILAPGTYDFKLIVKSLIQSEKMDSMEIRKFVVRKFNTEKISTSDIELAQNITPRNPNEKGAFDKNKFSVQPNVLSYYDAENQNVYYYFEIYNLLKKFRGKFFSVKRTVLDGHGLPLYTLPSYVKKKRIRGNDDVEVGMFSIANLPSGKYLLHFAVIDSNEKEMAATNTNFYVHNQQFVVPDREGLTLEQQMASSEIALLSQELLDNIINATKYLVDVQEKKVVSSLDNEKAKRIYLYRYWKEHDDQPDTPALESFREMIRRVQYSNSNFRHVKKAGWDSDRGRILITYGKPSEIQYYTNVPDFKEFQAWSYDNIESGVVFIFGVIGGFGDLRLLHSTKTGETNNIYWLDLLKVSEGGTGISGMGHGSEQRQEVKDIFRSLNLEWPRYLK